MAGKLGYGTTIAIGDGQDPEDFSETIADVKNITPPGGTRTALDVTTNESPNQTMEYIRGLFQPGVVSFEVLFDPDPADPIREEFERTDTSAPTNFRLTFVGGVTATFAGVMTDYQPTGPTEDKMVANVSIQISGVVAWA